jgi:glycogen phosphorylase
MYLYNKLSLDPSLDICPRTFIFSGKAARSYYEAKQTIKLITSVAEKVNNNPRIKNKIKVVFLENYRVSLCEKIITAAEISEQISTASKEASGTGNMKLMMNGAVTLGTLDGANIEILDVIGENNIFTFGLKSEKVLNYYKNGGYDAYDVYQHNPPLKQVIDQLLNGFFPLKEEEFSIIYSSLLYQNDPYFVLKDFVPYLNSQNQIDSRYRARTAWAKMALKNIANSGGFSSDRTIKEYADDIWHVSPIEFPLY